jgi:hypothetical protein
MSESQSLFYLLQVSFSLDAKPNSSYTEIDDVKAQTTCLQRPLHDGETYDVYIKAWDIMGNSKVRGLLINCDVSNLFDKY